MAFRRLNTDQVCQLVNFLLVHSGRCPRLFLAFYAQERLKHFTNKDLTVAR
jgi:hypothetical protein